jgi:anti-sigma regulatory factor (Ser/Thr protein kinase)
VAGAAPFVRDGLAADEAVMVATTPTNLAALKRALGPDRGSARLVDLSQAGRNPGRILSLWREFVAGETNGDRRARGIGEPVWRGRTTDELDECRRHEALINAAFDGDADFWLVCPYDRSTLDGATLEAMERTHPVVHEAGRVRESAAFDSALAERALEGELPPAGEAAERFDFDRLRLGELRWRVRSAAERAGMTSQRLDDLLVSVTELAANAIRHGDGTGAVAMWRDADTFLCEVEGNGSIDDPLAGRVRPLPDEIAGRGLWIVHQLCDLVQIRSSEGRSTIRVTMRIH